MRKRRLIGFGVAAAAIAVSAGLIMCYPQKAFDAEKILAESELSGRTFKGEVVEISADEGKIKAYFMEEHSVPVVSVSFMFLKAGKAYEKKTGTALLAESVLLDGAGKYDRKAFRALLKEKGIGIRVSANDDTLNFSLLYIKAFEKEAIEALKVVMYEPRLENEDLELVKRQFDYARKQQTENPQYLLERLIREEFYKKHPYGREDIAAKEELEAVTAEDIRAYLKAVMGKDNLSAGIAGDLSVGEAEAFLREVFGGLAERAEVSDLPVGEWDFHKEAVWTEAPFSAQSYVMLRGRGVKRLDEDFYPLYVGNYIFGGAGLSSKLNEEVREKEGLTYGIYSGFSNADGIDLWQVYFSATPENAQKAYMAAEKLYLDFYNNGVSVDEAERAKKSLISSFNLRFSSLSDISFMLEQMQAQGLGADFLKKRQGYVLAVTAEKINDAVKRRMPAGLGGQNGVRLFGAKGKKM